VKTGTVTNICKIKTPKKIVTRSLHIFLTTPHIKRKEKLNPGQTLGLRETTPMETRKRKKTQDLYLIKPPF
ncbi:hypothetical protein, partial [Priestia megaterium]|uniref:hypothetical protein n=1 Tax=Priestia megaterium TaxID=1404 RepID=UPI001CA4EB16